MAFNIYEDLDFNMDVKCSKTAGADEEQNERVERLVDIYESADKDQRVWTKGEGAHTAVGRNRHRAAALVLGLLCLLLVVALIVLFKLYNSMSLENKMVSIRYVELQNKYHILEKGHCQGTKYEKHGDIAEWKIYQGSSYYKSTEMRNWTESRRDCECREAHLVVIGNHSEQVFVRNLIKPEASWIGLVPERDQKEWKWVDGTQLTYRAWRVHVKVHPENVNMSRAYIDLDGKWNQTTEGIKRWICEKKIHRV